VRGTSLVMLSFKVECCYFAVKKRYSSVGSGCEPKLFVKYKIIGSGTKCKYIFILFGGLDSCFLLGNVVFLSSRAERVNVVKSQKWGLCPRPLLMKLFSRNGVFTTCSGNGLSLIFFMTINYSLKFNCCKKVTY